MGLEGITILDLTQNSPGQSACSALADLGASVIAVGRPGYGKARGFARAWSVGRNKRSILVDVKDPRGKEIFHRLARGADVVVEGFRPGVTDKLGIGYEDLRRLRPDIIYCSLSGFGQDGPYRDVPGHDPQYQAISGALPLDEQGRPFLPTTNWADRQACMNVQVAVLVALLVRERQGGGQYIDVAISDSMTTVPQEESVGHPLVERILTGGPPGSEAPPSKFLQGKFPCFKVYECGDGKYLSLGIIEPWFWERLCKHFGKSEWISHQEDEGPLRDEMFAFFRQAFKSKPRDEWYRILSSPEVDTQVSPVNIGYEVIGDPHVRAREAVIEVETPGGRKMWQVGFPFKMSVTRGQVWRSVTVAGQDTVAILEGLGYAEQEIRALERDRVIEALPADFAP